MSEVSATSHESFPLPLGEQLLNLSEGAPSQDYVPELETDIMYSALLRELAKARLHDRRQAAAGGVAFNSANWEPQIETLAQSADQRTRRLARCIFTQRSAANFDPLSPELPFYEHQQEPFKLVVDYLGNAKRAENREELCEQVSKVIEGGFAKMPPGFGKTLDIVYGCVASGAGEVLPGAEDGKRIRNLCLVPTRKIMQQIVGKKGGEDKLEEEVVVDNAAAEEEADTSDEEEALSAQEMLSGFARFAPDKKVAKYDRGNNARNKEQDVLVMTYHAFNLASRAGRISPEDFDTIFGDESHCMLGVRTKEMINAYRREGVRVIGFSASDTYSDGREMSSVLGKEICNLSFRDQINLGRLPPVQLLGVATNSEIKVTRRNAVDYTFPELRSLAQDEERNVQGLDWVQLLVEQGRQVFVPSIPGYIDYKSCWHARHLAERISNRSFYDSELGIRRGIRGEAIGSFQTSSEQEEVLRRWYAGEIDALFTVNMLGVGWSSKEVAAVVDLSPTTSPVIMDQRVGRLTRANPDWPVKIYVAFLDKVHGHKPQYTPWHTLEEDVIDPDVIIGWPDENDEPREGDENEADKPSKPKGHLDKDDLPESLRHQLSPQYMLVDDVIISESAERFKEPSPEHVPLADHHSLWVRLGLAATCSLLKSKGWPYEIAAGRKGPMRHVHKDAIEFLKNYKIPDVATDMHFTPTQSSDKLGISLRYMRKLAEELGIETQDRISPKRRAIQPYYHDDDLARIAVLNEEKSQFEDGDEAVRHIAAEFGLSTGAAQYYMTTRLDPPAMGIPKMLPSRQEAIVVNAEDAGRLRRLLKSMVVTEENGRHTVAMLMLKSGQSRNKVLRAMRKTGADKKQKSGLYQHAETGNFHYAKYINRQDSEKVLRMLGVVTKEISTPTEALEILQCSEAAFPILCAMAKIDSSHFVLSEEDGSIVGVPVQVIERLKALQLPPPREGWYRHGRLKEISEKTGRPIPPFRGFSADSRMVGRRTSPPQTDIYYTATVAKIMIRSMQNRRPKESD